MVISCLTLRQIKEIPLDMKIRLPPSLATSLEVRAPLNGVKLQQTVQSLLRFFRREFDLIFPSLNAPLLLYKHITNLGLPGMSLDDVCWAV